MTPVRALMGSAPQSNARIDHGVDDVDQQIDDHDHGAPHDHHALYHREVAEGDPLIEEPPDPGPGEHGLDDDRDIDHQNKIDPGQGQYRDQRILECMLADYEGL